MAYEWAEHIGELELWVQAATREEVFAEALAALRELLDGDADGPPATRAIELAGDEPAVLLADWLAELAFLAETESFVPSALERLELAPGVLRARVAGRRGAPPHLVKAVTYHKLAFEPRGEGWHAVAVLDV